MLSERITNLFRILQCSNTDIARFAGCSPSNISRLKSGTREPGPESRSVRRLVEGVYRYADYENMLSVLRQLCGADDNRAETLIPAIVAWLYAESDFTPPRTRLPKSKRFQEIKRRSFGEKLDKAMTLLGVTNGQLASALHVDVSLISRYRSGIYHPNRNERIKERLAEFLLEEAKSTGQSDALADLFNIKKENLSTDLLMDVLYERNEEKNVQIAEALFRSIDTLAPSRLLLPERPEIPPVGEAERYWGTDGLRQAVIRFLTDTARDGGELLLYSDEPLDWIAGDREYFSLWSYLMESCVREKVHIKIIHNVDRIDAEMIFSINAWLPLYISGMIEPYIFRTTKNPMFYHTVFLRSGSAAVYGSFPAGIGERRWYDYITDPRQLNIMADGYGAMLADASPLLKIYPAQKSDSFHRFLEKHSTEEGTSILHGFTIGTMPEGLIEQMLTRSDITGPARDNILQIYEEYSSQVRFMLDQGSIHDLICLPDEKEIRNRNLKVNFGIEAVDLTLTYTPEEYAQHVSAICDLVGREKNYHLTLLPNTLFADLQIFVLKDALAVLRCREPHTAFVFLNSEITRSVSDYCKILIQQYPSDRITLIETLRKHICL